VTSFLDGLSIFLPRGERFFVKSVKRFAPIVSDPKLRAEVEAFCAQEGHHGREHSNYNRRLDGLGYPAAALDRRVGRILWVAEKILSDRSQLAVTTALEHFTSILGEGVLEHPAAMQGADPTMTALWRWHSAEESEHKTVAFDVYLAAGGTWLNRVLIMLLTSAVFWPKVLEHQLRFMAVDRTLFSLAQWRTLVTHLFVEPGLVRALWRPYLAYFGRSFHPSDRARRDLVDQWRGEQLRTGS
jgi:predicted metal-dependent hydrolase